MRAVATIHDNGPAGRSATCIGAAAVLLAFAGSAWAQLEVSTTTLPRFDGAEHATRSTRVGVTLLPQQPSALGLAFGMSNVFGAQPAVSPYGAGLPSMDFGIHWRVMLDSHYRFDLTAYRRVPNADAISMIESREPGYGARLELGMGSINGRSKGFVADRGFVGFQLEGGGRVTVNRSHGTPMLYYRNEF